METEFEKESRHHPEPAPDDSTQPESAARAVINDEVAMMHDRWMRAEAETANVRARAKRDIADARQFAVQKFAADVVEAADNLRRGLDSIPIPKATEAPIVTRLRDGFTGVERSFIDLLKRHGIEREDPTGAPFNAQRHQAIAEQHSPTHAAGTILQTASSAWTLNGRLLRPAMVVVATAAPAPAEDMPADEPT